MKEKCGKFFKPLAVVLAFLCLVFSSPRARAQWLEAAGVLWDGLKEIFPALADGLGIASDAIDIAKVFTEVEAIKEQLEPVKEWAQKIKTADSALNVVRNYGLKVDQLVSKHEYILSSLESGVDRYNYLVSSINGGNLSLYGVTSNVRADMSMFRNLYEVGYEDAKLVSKTISNIASLIATKRYSLSTDDLDKIIAECDKDLDGILDMVSSANTAMQAFDAAVEVVKIDTMVGMLATGGVPVAEVQDDGVVRAADERRELEETGSKVKSVFGSSGMSVFESIVILMTVIALGMIVVRFVANSPSGFNESLMSAVRYVAVGGVAFVLIFEVLKLVAK